MAVHHGHRQLVLVVGDGTEPLDDGLRAALGVALDDEDDVQEIYANFEISDEIMAEINA